MPSLHKASTPLKSLPWARPISTLGGFDDCGSLWVPPAGSSVAIMFENGSNSVPYYLGTIWNLNRGPEGQNNWGYGIPEYQCIHQGHRKGYFVGANDESQVRPPSNTENYNIKDYDDLNAFERDPTASTKITPSHIYMFKTPQKHRFKMDDGNYSCNQKYKRIEIGSSCGNIFLMWDDHMHAPGQHLNPKAAQQGPNASGGSGAGLVCGTESCQSDDRRDKEPKCGDYEGDRFKNDLFKHESEVRAFRGPGTPQNNRCQLKQTGIYISSISGTDMTFDDRVDDPRGTPDWERGTKVFDFGCTNKFLGKWSVRSATGHEFTMSDAEDKANVRSGDNVNEDTQLSEPNGFTLRTASGNSIQLNDHTIQGGTAGSKRGIRIESTSKNLFEMIDEGNEQASPDRKGGGVPKNKAKKAYIRLKTGYGCQLLMRDDGDQEKTNAQFIELLAPHKDNCNGPHILRFQEKSENQPGIVLLRCGGYFLGASTREWIEVVGDPNNQFSTCGQKASKITKVTEHNVNLTDQYYINMSKVALHQSSQYIILSAGQDCQDSQGNLGPCIFPVLVGKKLISVTEALLTGKGFCLTKDSLSNRVFASTGDA